MSPNGGEVITTSAILFRADITDASGIKSVSFEIQYPSGQTQTFNNLAQTGDTFAVTISGFTASLDGAWKWRVIAKDGASGGGNSNGPPYDEESFTLSIGGGAPPPPECNENVSCPPDGFECTSDVCTAGVCVYEDICPDGGICGATGCEAPPPPPTNPIVNSPWTKNGIVQTAAGRIYFEMPSNRKKNRWNGYVCSGTSVTGGEQSGLSIVVTAAHCVYDDANKAFARNVLFIPNQDATTGSGTDTDCTNDPLGCFTPFAGVIDSNWGDRSWPDNIPWDYAFLVFDNNDRNLEDEAGSLNVSFVTPTVGAWTHALGYSYSDDPNFMYSAEAMSTQGADNWWLGSSGLSGGSSGGPWVQPMDESTGAGPVMSVNSWGYSTSPGMAGPMLSGSSAECLFRIATTLPLYDTTPPDGEEGRIVDAGISCSPQAREAEAPLAGQTEAKGEGRRGLGLVGGLTLGVGLTLVVAAAVMVQRLRRSEREVEVHGVVKAMTELQFVEAGGAGEMAAQKV